MSKINKSIYASIVILFACISFVLPAKAQSLGGFEFTRFESNIVINEDGSIDISEKITGEFFEERHGLFRYIPYKYQNSNGTDLKTKLELNSVFQNGKPATFEFFTEGSHKVIKIGDADITFSGPFEYQINYHVEDAILFHDENDELYWDVTGSEWAESIPQVFTSITIPGAEKESLQAKCFTGYYGSVKEGCTYNIKDGEVKFAANDFLTVAILFPKGIVPEPSDFEKFMIFLFIN